MEPLLAQLESRDGLLASELARVEREQAEVDALRARAEAAAELAAWLPQAVSENEDALREARRARDAAAVADENGEVDEAALAAADARVARLEEHRRAFARQAQDVRDDLARLPSVESLSQRRGELLVAHSNLARERESVVREASELLASVTGDAFAATSVAGLRDRLT